MDTEFLEFIKEEKTELEKLLKNNSCIVVFHSNDADGVTSLYLFVQFLKRINCTARIIGVESLTKAVIDELLKTRIKNVVFLDIGSGYLDLLNELNYEKNIFIIDHHKPQPAGVAAPGAHINPEVFGLKGDEYASAATIVAYMLLEELETRKLDAAIIGALGDLQDLRAGKLLYLNAEIVKEAEKHGCITRYLDLAVYYKEQSIAKCLASLEDPYIPEISGNPVAAFKLLQEVGIPLSRRQLRWIDLDYEEKQKIINYLAVLLLEYGEFDNVFRLVKEHYYSKRLRDECRRLATIINSMSKYGFVEEALRFLDGKIDRKTLERFREKHKENIKKSLEIARKRCLVESSIAVLDLRGCCHPGIIGAVTGLFLQAQQNLKVAIGVAQLNGYAKISVRARDPEIDLSILVREAAKRCGGFGGGHAQAAGALIPQDKITDFITYFKEALKNESKNLHQGS
ncbi:MAG: DHH family phosphoesterase [bacterium]|nr:DHH family phosphoesterase [bacterium]